VTTPMPLATSPYISPTTLTTAPTGIDWSSIPSGDDVTPQENESEWWNICQRATAAVNGYCNQVLRATIDTELLHGPDFRVTCGPAAGGSFSPAYWFGGGSGTYNARILLSRFPILEVVSVATCPNTVFPRTWTALPAGYFEPEVPPIGIYGSVSPSSEAFGSQAIIVAPGYIDWSNGRNGWAVPLGDHRERHGRHEHPDGGRLHRLGDYELGGHPGCDRGGQGRGPAGDRARDIRVRGVRAGDPHPVREPGVPARAGDPADDPAREHRGSLHPVRDSGGTDPGRDHDHDSRHRGTCPEHGRGRGGAENGSGVALSSFQENYMRTSRRSMHYNSRRACHRKTRGSAIADTTNLGKNPAGSARSPRAQKALRAQKA
jgi:hypothetical protein